MSITDKRIIELDTATELEPNDYLAIDNAINGTRKMRAGSLGEDFTGATAQQGGSHGLVPAPDAGDEDKYLKGDGSWGEVQTPLTFDDAPTANSNNPVKSGGVYNAIDVVSSKVSELLVEERTRNLFSGWIKNKRYTSSGVPSTGNPSRYIATDYLDFTAYTPISAATTFYIKGINSSGLSFYVLCYDENKTYLNRSSVSSDGTFSIPITGVKYVILASNSAFSTSTAMDNYVDNAQVMVSKDNIPYEPYFTHKINRDYLPNDLGKALVVWIDDDTSSLARLARVKNVADAVGMCPTLACITKYIVGEEEITGLKEKLLELQNDYGYEIVSHSQEHGDIWKSWQTGVYNPKQCEKSLIKSMENLRDCGFLEYDYLVAPFGECTATTQTFVKKWAKCLVNAGANSTGQNYQSTDSIWNINRIFISSEDEFDLSYYTDMIDDAIVHNSLLVFGTHLSSNDVQLVTDVLNYAKNQGVEITTLSGALRQKMHWYYNNELM